MSARCASAGRASSRAVVAVASLAAVLMLALAAPAAALDVSSHLPAEDPATLSPVAAQTTATATAQAVTDPVEELVEAVDELASKVTEELPPPVQEIIAPLPVIGTDEPEEGSDEPEERSSAPAPPAELVQPAPQQAADDVPATDVEVPSDAEERTAGPMVPFASAEAPDRGDLLDAVVAEHLPAPVEEPETQLAAPPAMTAAPSAERDPREIALEVLFATALLVLATGALTAEFAPVLRR